MRFICSWTCVISVSLRRGGSPMASAWTYIFARVSTSIASQSAFSSYFGTFRSGTVSQYNIDPLTGALSLKTPATVAAGDTPWTIAVRSPGVPTSKDQCKNGGYEHFIDPSTGQPFKNQGRCIQFVETGK